MVDKLIYIPNDDIQNYPFYIAINRRKVWTLKESTNHNLATVHKVVRPTNKKMLL